MILIAYLRKYAAYLRYCNSYDLNDKRGGLSGRRNGISICDLLFSLKYSFVGG